MFMKELSYRLSLPFCFLGPLLYDFNDAIRLSHANATMLATAL